MISTWWQDIFVVILEPITLHYRGMIYSMAHVNQNIIKNFFQITSQFEFIFGAYTVALSKG